MKHTFVLNENIVIAVSTLRNERGERDHTSADLFNAIVANCHRVAWSPALNERWSRQVQTLQNQGSAIAPSFMTLFSQARFVDGKCPWPEAGDPAPLSGEDSWSSKLQDDQDFLRLAAHFPSSFLVTADEPLREDVNDLGLDETHSFQVVSPEEAISLAQKDDAAESRNKEVPA